MTAPVDPRDALRKQELANIAIVYDYLRDAKKNYVRLACPTDQLAPRAARFLHANNGYARIKFADLMCNRIDQLVTTLLENDEKNVFFLTLAPGAFCLPEAVAHTFQPSEFKAVVEDFFGDCNLFGIIEGAYYPRVKRDAAPVGGSVSFHGHFVVWGKPERTLSRKVQQFCTHYKCFLVAMKSGHLKRIKLAEATNVLLYAYKSPENKYTVQDIEREEMNPETGEFISWLYQRQHKDPFRPGERVRLSNIMRHQYLDQLQLAFGAGTAVSRDILAEAYRDYPEHRERGF